MAGCRPGCRVPPGRNLHSRAPARGAKVDSVKTVGPSEVPTVLGSASRVRPGFKGSKIHPLEAYILFHEHIARAACISYLGKTIVCPGRYELSIIPFLVC
jgi:hypothetical protein